DLHVLRLAAAAPFDVNVSTNPGAAGHDLVTVTFGQTEPFAGASLTLGTPERGTAAGDVEPPAALTLEAYRPMDTRSGTSRPSLHDLSTARPWNRTAAAHEETGTLCG